LSFDPKAARAEILGMLNRAPPAHSRWTYGQAIDFKKEAAMARKTAGNTRATKESLEAALVTMKRWYDQQP